MINDIINGICVAINKQFGDEYEIYTESVEQGFQEPCFSIVCLNPTINQVISKRYFRENQFCIHYFPKTREKRFECHQVSDRLFDALECITVTNDSILGTNIYSEIVDGVLSFFVNYDMYVYKNEDEKENMESVIHDTNVKG